MAKGERLVSIRELREIWGVKLSVDDFVSQMEPCGDPAFYLPAPEVREYLMDPEKAEKAKAYLETCMGLAGTWGELRIGKEDPGFTQAAKSFEELTGVSVVDIMNEARSRRDRHLVRND